MEKSNSMNILYNTWLFKKWSDVQTMTMQEIDDAFGEELKRIEKDNEPGPLMKEFKAFLQEEPWKTKESPSGEEGKEKLG